MKNLDFLIPKDAPKGGSWAWGEVRTYVVIGGSVRYGVRLDGEDEDLEANPIFMVDPGEFSTRTGRSRRALVQLVDGQVIVHGNGRGLPILPSGIGSGDGAVVDLSPAVGRGVWDQFDAALRISDGSGGWFRVDPTRHGTTTQRNIESDSWGADTSAIGVTFYDTDLDQFMVWDGADWITIGPPAAGSVDLTVGSNSVGSGGSPGTDLSTYTNNVLTGFTRSGATLTCDVAGRYTLTAYASFPAVTTGAHQRGLVIWLDGAQYRHAFAYNSGASASMPNSHGAALNFGITLDAGDTIKMSAQQNSGATLSTNGGWLTLDRVG